ncbi:MAG: Rne/Rng family ribonuclease, partial [Planctomycetota bacterium]
MENENQDQGAVSASADSQDEKPNPAARRRRRRRRSAPEAEPVETVVAEEPAVVEALADDIDDEDVEVTDVEDVDVEADEIDEPVDEEDDDEAAEEEASDDDSDEDDSDHDTDDEPEEKPKKNKRVLKDIGLGPDGKPKNPRKRRTRQDREANVYRDREEDADAADRPAPAKRARPEPQRKEMFINVTEGEECRIALLEDGVLEELYLERTTTATNVGNIYLGKVNNVESSIQAAFVDFGYGRNGFLHVQDLHPWYMGSQGKNIVERVGKKLGRRDRPPIQQCLRRGDQIMVQIIKEGIGTKGPTLSSYLSIPGRYLVMMPGVTQMGVSKKIEDEPERRRLRKILDGLEPPKDVGFIIRTAGVGKTKAEIERDFKYLVRVWEAIEKKRKASKPPVELYSEGDLVTRTIRDVWTSELDRVVVDDKDTLDRIEGFFKLAMPRTKHNIELYTDTEPLFNKFGIEPEVEKMFSREVPMKSGGSLVIDATEAVVAIDVNSGKFRVHDDAEETAYRVDLEAADEICRQLRLRDLGGVVLCDFIDLRYRRHREALHDRLTENFERDKAKSRHLPMNEFGIVAITRQRMRPDLKKAVFMPCPLSDGTGWIKTPESMALEVMRKLRVAAAHKKVRRIDVSLYPTVATHMLNHKRINLAELEDATDKDIFVRADDELSADDIKLVLFDEREGLVFMPELDVTPESTKNHKASLPVSDLDQPRGKRRRRGKLLAKDDSGVGSFDAEVLEDPDEDDEEDKPKKRRRRRRRGRGGKDRDGETNTESAERDEDANPSSGEDEDAPAEPEADASDGPTDEAEEADAPTGRRRRRRRGR